MKGVKDAWLVGFGLICCLEQIKMNEKIATKTATKPPLKNENNL